MSILHAQHLAGLNRRAGPSIWLLTPDMLLNIMLEIDQIKSLMAAYETRNCPSTDSLRRWKRLRSDGLREGHPEVRAPSGQEAAIRRTPRGGPDQLPVELTGEPRFVQCWRREGRPHVRSGSITPS